MYKWRECLVRFENRFRFPFSTRHRSCMTFHRPNPKRMAVRCNSTFSSTEISHASVVTHKCRVSAGPVRNWQWYARTVNRRSRSTTILETATTRTWPARVMSTWWNWNRNIVESTDGQILSLIFYLDFSLWWILP